METIAFAYCFKLFHASSFSAKPKAGVAKSLISLLSIPSNCGFWKTTETTGTTNLKWQPAFRLVKVVFVVVFRQHRVQNQTVVPVVCVVVKTKAQKIIDKSERLVETRYCLTGSRMGTTYPRASPPCSSPSGQIASESERFA